MKKKKRITKLDPNPETKPKKYISTWKANITKKDITLTNEEKELIKQELSTHPKLDIFCYCCQTVLISDIICRSFFSCGKCYCCVGDEPAFDDDEWIENHVCSEGVFNKYNNDYHFTKDKDFYC